MVEQEAVNFEVAGSSPAPGAIIYKYHFMWYCLYMNSVNSFETPSHSLEVASQLDIALNADIIDVHFPYRGPDMASFEAQNKRLLRGRRTINTVAEELEGTAAKINDALLHRTGRPTLITAYAEDVSEGTVLDVLVDSSLDVVEGSDGTATDTIGMLFSGIVRSADRAANLTREARKFAFPMYNGVLVRTVFSAFEGTSWSQPTGLQVMRHMPDGSMAPVDLNTSNGIEAAELLGLYSKNVRRRRATSQQRAA